MKVTRLLKASWRCETYPRAYERSAREAEDRIAPIQSMSLRSRNKTVPSAFSSTGKAHKLMKNRAIVSPPHIYHPTLHPTVSRSTPPRTKPREKPMGCTKPKQENPIFRWRPLVVMLATIATEVGRQSDTATPWKARNIINSMPVLPTPHAMMKQPTKKQPIVLTRRLPTTSAMDPAMIRQDPLANLEFKAFSAIIYAPKNCAFNHGTTYVYTDDGLAKELL